MGRSVSGCVGRHGGWVGGWVGRSVSGCVGRSVWWVDGWVDRSVGRPAQTAGDSVDFSITQWSVNIFVLQSIEHDLQIYIANLPYRIQI